MRLRHLILIRALIATAGTFDERANGIRARIFGAL